MTGFIGMGNMGFALLKGLLKSFEPEELMFSCRTEEKREEISKLTGVKGTVNGEVASACGCIILAVKPQTYEEVFEEIKDKLLPGAILISLAPGKSIDYIKRRLGEDKRVVRAMPNTPALIGCGMTGIAYDETLFSVEEKELIDRLFSSVGSYEKVPEEAISAVVCASGSSPAYVYMFIDALSKAAASKGLPEETALSMVTGAVMGAAMMVKESGESPEVLKSRVCSKGGTTIAGIGMLEEQGFTEAIEAATEACYRRSEELGAD